MTDDHTQGPDVSAWLRDGIAAFAHPQAWRRLKDAINELAAVQAKYDEARAAVDALHAEQEKARAAMAAEAEAHRRQLTDQTMRFNNEINTKRNELAKLEAAAKDASAKAEEDARQAVELRARWQKKVDAIDAGLRA
jgi:chromosome segregation ATPase